MSEQLGAMYHWSPRDRRAAILRDGLQPASRSSVASGEQGCISLGPTPSKAWAYSGDMGWTGEVDDWDLWQVRLIDTDHANVRTDFGPVIVEVKVYNAIAAERCWWIGERQPWLTAEERA